MSDHVRREVGSVPKEIEPSTDRCDECLDQLIADKRSGRQIVEKSMQKVSMTKTTKHETVHRGSLCKQRCSRAKTWPSTMAGGDIAI